MLHVLHSKYGSQTECNGLGKLVTAARSEGFACILLNATRLAVCTPYKPDAQCPSYLVLRSVFLFLTYLFVLMVVSAGAHEIKQECGEVEAYGSACHLRSK
jgi:hypothetical protein